jgi:hypothetical protein
MPVISDRGWAMEPIPTKEKEQGLVYHLFLKNEENYLL